LSPGGAAELETSFDEMEHDLRAQAAEQQRASEASWEFDRRAGSVADELIAAATAVGKAHPDDTVGIIIGSSSHATRRMVGSVAVHLARHSPVTLMIVP
jgi:nucleotide-binding universal stress UspA family protein